MAMTRTKGQTSVEKVALADRIQELTGEAMPEIAVNMRQCGVYDASDLLGPVSADNINNNIDKELAAAKKFMCSCKLNSGQPCYTQFHHDQVIRRRMAMQDLSRGERDLIVLGMISCNINLSEKTCRSKHSDNTERLHPRSTYFVEAKQVCRETFLFMHLVTRDLLTTLIKRYRENGFRPKQSGAPNQLKKMKTLEYSTRAAHKASRGKPSKATGFKPTSSVQPADAQTAPEPTNLSDASVSSSSRQTTRSSRQI